jgi:hypothetical protein
MNIAREKVSLHLPFKKYIHLGASWIRFICRRKKSILYLCDYMNYHISNICVLVVQHTLAFVLDEAHLK